MSIHDLGIPVAFVLYVFEEAYSKSMKRVEDRVIVICAILVDKYAAWFEKVITIRSHCSVPKANGHPERLQP